jgi:hypothetical protein
MRQFLSPSFRLCLLLLLAAEILLRGTLPPLAVAAFRYGYDPDAGFRETADGQVQLVPGPTRDFHAQTFSRARPPGEFRIFALGSSVEYWDAVGSHILSNTYPARLGVELRARGRNAESINLGVTSYGLRREEVLLRKILNYQPSLILLKVDDTNEGMDETTAERNRSYLSPWPQDWLWKSYLIQCGLKFKEDRLLNHTLPPRILVWTTGHPVQPPATTTAPFNKTSRRAMDECLQLARDRQVPVMLVTQAYVSQDAAGRSVVSDHGLDAYAATLCGPGVTMLSLTQLLGKLPVKETFSDQVHLARPTHELVARALAEAILKMGPAKPQP